MFAAAPDCRLCTLVLAGPEEAEEMAAAEQHILKALGWKGQGLITAVGGTGEGLHGDGDEGGSSDGGSSSGGGGRGG